MKKKVTTIIASTIAVLVFASYLLLTAAAPYKPQAYTQPALTPVRADKTYEVPAEVQPIVARLGLDKVLVSHVHIVITDGVDMCSGLVSGTASACYGNGNLYYPKNLLTLSASKQNTIFAHEYMHYIRSLLSDSDKAKYAAITQQLYVQYPGVRNRVKDYEPALYDNELHSYVCTEMKASEMPKEMLDHCVEYIPNRALLVATF